jgi:hypothetical protein
MRSSCLLTPSYKAYRFQNLENALAVWRHRPASCQQVPNVGLLRRNAGGSCNGSLTLIWITTPRPSSITPIASFRSDTATHTSIGAGNRVCPKWMALPLGIVAMRFGEMERDLRVLGAFLLLGIATLWIAALFWLMRVLEL